MSAWWVRWAPPTQSSYWYQSPLAAQGISEGQYDKEISHVATRQPRKQGHNADDVPSWGPLTLNPFFTFLLGSSRSSSTYIPVSGKTCLITPLVRRPGRVPYSKQSLQSAKMYFFFDPPKSD